MEFTPDLKLAPRHLHRNGGFIMPLATLHGETAPVACCSTRSAGSISLPLLLELEAYVRDPAHKLWERRGQTLRQRVGSCSTEAKRWYDFLRKWEAPLRAGEAAADAQAIWKRILASLPGAPEDSEKGIRNARTLRSDSLSARLLILEAYAGEHGQDYDRRCWDRFFPRWDPRLKNVDSLDATAQAIRQRILARLPEVQRRSPERLPAARNRESLATQLLALEAYVRSHTPELQKRDGKTLRLKVGCRTRQARRWYDFLRRFEVRLRAGGCGAEAQTIWKRIQGRAFRPGVAVKPQVARPAWKGLLLAVRLLELEAYVREHAHVLRQRAGASLRAKVGRGTAEATRWYEFLCWREPRLQAADAPAGVRPTWKRIRAYALESDGTPPKKCCRGPHP